MIAALLAVPALAGLAAFLIRGDRPRRALLAAAALLHAGLTLACWRTLPAPGGWLGLDAPGLLFLTIVSLLFLAAALYALDYLAREESGERVDFVGGGPFSNAPEARFTGCLLLFLATMTAVCVSRRFGLIWVATEATTLTSAPLIYYHRHHRSLEAAWKYLMLCSVGIALALLGNAFLAAAGPELTMDLDTLLAHAGALQPVWLKGAFVLFLAGYGTKMGLAPMHSWLPDAHSESPSLVSALLSGALLNCAFLGVLRGLQVLSAAGLGDFARGLLVPFGLLSMGVAAVFIQGQADYKRLLAYSSVEHMGILALGVGLGGTGVFGAMLHAVNHSVVKALLFLCAGNILAAYKTKSAADARGVLRVLPWTGALWLAGLLAAVGAPPFGPFVSEFAVLKAAADQGRSFVVVAYLSCLTLVFVGMATTGLRMSLGPASRKVEARETPLSVAVPAALALAALVLGVWVPPPLRRLLAQAARTLGGAG